jgi:saccharopine dehydrogenase (NAD+, L-lysine-forming)
MTKIGIRREDKSRWERRVPITPDKVRELRETHGLEFYVQPSPTRVFREEEFQAAGAVVQDDLSPASTIFAVKEIPSQYLELGKTYIFFAHVIKGQPYNMPMLRRMMELGCNLIDYEKVVDDKGRRLIFFGWHAGVVAMIDSLWALGQRLQWEGIANPFATVRNTYTYDGLASARADVRAAGKKIEAEGLPTEIAPLIIGVAGYGNVGRGIQEILSDLPTVEIQPDEVADVANNPNASNRVVYRVTFKEEHLVAPNDPQQPFELEDYYQHPEKYHGVFDRYIPYLTVIMNSIYWNSRYPRLVSKDYLREFWANEPHPRLRVIGDASCDIEGAAECNLKVTEPDDPVYVYDPATEQETMGVTGRGPVVLAVDILPSELPREASEYFSGILEPFVPAIARADFSVPFEELDLPPEIKRAVIVYHGELTSDYRYIQQYLDR